MKLTHGETLLILVRHGQSEGNVNPDVYKEKNNREIALTKRGKRESRTTGKRISALLEKLIFKLSLPDDLRLAMIHDVGHDNISLELHHMAFICSPYLRAKQTLSEILNAFDSSWPTDIDGNPIREELLCSEQGWGDAEGTSGYDAHIEDIRLEIDKPTYDREKRIREILDPIWYRPTRGESLMDVYTRAGLFLEKFQWFRSKRVAIVSAHKGFLTMLHYYLTDKLPDISEFTALGLAGGGDAATQGWQNGEHRLYVLTPTRYHRSEYIDNDELTRHFNL